MQKGMITRLLPGGGSEVVPHVFCDICGWGDCIVESRDGFDFCRRHKQPEIEKFIADKAAGLPVGYVDKYPEYA